MMNDGMVIIETIRDGFCRVTRYCMKHVVTKRAGYFDHPIAGERDCKMAQRGCWHGRSKNTVMLISWVLWFI